MLEEYPDLLTRKQAQELRMMPHSQKYIWFPAQKELRRLLSEFIQKSFRLCKSLVQFSTKLVQRLLYKH